MSKIALFYGAHPDDVEQGAGVLIQRLMEIGFDVRVTAFTFGLDTNLVREMRAAMRVLKVPSWTVMEYAVRTLPDIRGKILDVMCEDNKMLDPSIVVTNSIHDKHQDHKVIGEEAMRAFNCTLIQYPFLRNQPLGNHVNVFVEPTDTEYARKMDAINCYESQKWREWSSKEVTISTMQLWGSYIKRPYAEAYENVRMIIFGL